MSRKDKPIEIESRLLVTWEEGKRGGTADGQERSFWGDRNFLKLGCGDGYPIFNLLKNKILL